MSTHNVNAETIWILRQQGALDDPALAAAIDVAQITPTPVQWRQFLLRTGVVLGALALGLGVIFLIAANWDALGRFARLGLVALAISALTAVAAYFGPERALSRAALLAAALMVGALLAVLGQTYHSGAGVEQLLLVWCVLILPWCWVAQRGWMWLLPLVLVNSSIFIGAVSQRWWWLADADSVTATLTVIALLNAAVCALLDWRRADWQALRNLALGLSLAALTFNTVAWIAGDAASGEPLVVLLLGLHLGALATVGVWYRQYRFDVTALALGALSVIVTVMALLIRFVVDSASDFASWLGLAAALIAMSGAAGWWLTQQLRARRA